MGGANDFISSVIKNPAIVAAVTSIEALGVPAASISAAEANPVVLLENLVADYTNTALIAAVPTALGNTLRTVLAVPLKAIEDIASFITYLEGQPEFENVLSELKEYIPTSIQQEFAASPIPFLENLVEQNTIPPYFSAVPTAIVDEAAATVNEGLAIVLSDFESPSITTVPTIPGTGTGPHPTSFASLTGSVPYGYNNTRSSAGTRGPVTTGLSALPTHSREHHSRHHVHNHTLSAAGTESHVTGPGVVTVAVTECGPASDKTSSPTGIEKREDGANLMNPLKGRSFGPSFNHPHLRNARPFP